MEQRPVVNAVLRVAVICDAPLCVEGLLTLFAGELDLELLPVSLLDVPHTPEISIILLWNYSVVEACQAMTWLKARSVAAPVLLAGKEAPDECLLEFLRAGAKGFVEDGAPTTELMKALRTIGEGSIWLPRRILATFIDRAQTDGASAFRGQIPILTPREKQVLQMLVTGFSNKEMSGPLGITVRTVKSHVAKLMKKVGARNRTMLSVHAVAFSLVVSP